MKPVSKHTERLTHGLGLRVGSGHRKCAGNSGFVLSSLTMGAEPSASNEREIKYVRNCTIKNVEASLAELRNILNDLQLVELRHPAHKVAIHAQAALADVAALVLRTWPANAEDSLQPIFHALYQVADGAFHQRWALLHRTGGAKGAKDGEKKAVLLGLLQSFECDHAKSYRQAIESAAKIRTHNFNDPNCLCDVELVDYLSTFYQSIDGLIHECKTQPKNATRLAWAAEHLHFDKFWKTVCRPYFFHGRPSRWQKVTKHSPFDGNRAPSKSELQLKRLLLQGLRETSLGIVTKTAVDT